MGGKDGTREAASRVVKADPADRGPGFDFPFGPLHGVTSDAVLLSE